MIDEVEVHEGRVLIQGSQPLHQSPFGVRPTKLYWVELGAARRGEQNADSFAFKVPFDGRRVMICCAVEHVHGFLPILWPVPYASQEGL